MIEHLYEAQMSDHGIVIETDDPEALRQRLYKIRRDHVGEFDNLSFVLSPFNPAGELWIVKKGEPNATTPE